MRVSAATGEVEAGGLPLGEVLWQFLHLSLVPPLYKGQLI